MEPPQVQHPLPEAIRGLAAVRQAELQEFLRSVGGAKQGLANRDLAIFEATLQRVDNSLQLLRLFIGEVSETEYDATQVQTLLEQLSTDINCLYTAFDHRFRPSQSHVSVAEISAESVERAEGELRVALLAVKETIENLQAANKDSAAPGGRSIKRLSQIKRTQSNGLPYQISRAIEEESKNCKSAGRVFSVGRIQPLWDQIKARPEIIRHVDNAGDPGDGVVFDEKDVTATERTLVLFHNAMTSTAVDGEVPGIDLISKTSRICLVLKHMQQPCLIDRFLAQRCTDDDLLLKLEDIEEILDVSTAAPGSDMARLAKVFANEQYRAKEWCWQGHAEKIPKARPLPFNKWSSSRLGHGKFCIVTAEENAFNSAERFALKTTKKFEGNDAERNNRNAHAHLNVEIQQLKNLTGIPHVVGYYRSYQRGTELGLLETLGDINLDSVLMTYSNRQKDSRERKILFPELMHAFGCLSRGLDGLHSDRHSIRHRDIKPGNIVCDRTEANRGKLGQVNWMWADFGRALAFGNLTHGSRTNQRLSGVERYAAPEIALPPTMVDSPIRYEGFKQMDRRWTHGRPSDIYSLGIIFLEILSVLIGESYSALPGAKRKPGEVRVFQQGYRFFDNIDQVIDWADNKQKSRPKDDPLIPLFDVAKKMITKEQNDRPTITDVIQHLRQMESFYFCDECLRELRSNDSSEDPQDLIDQVKSLHLATASDVQT